MMLEFVPVSIYELLTVLPKEIRVETSVGIDIYYRLRHYWASDILGWYVGYEDTEWRAVKRATELVDALGKLLIWCIQEGWVG